MEPGQLMEVGFAAVGVTLLVIVVSLAVGAHRKRNSRLAIETAFAGRMPVSHEEFHERYFADRGVPSFVTIGVLKVLESEFEADLSRLSAADDFAGNLRFLRGHLEAPETMLSLEKVFEITISESDVHDMGTKVGDVVMLVWETLRKKQGMA
jgi:hypothetical protein